MNIKFQKIEETFFLAVCACAALITCLLLFMILSEITLQAIPSLTWYFITTPESETPHIGMGIANAIWGSVIISLIATLLAIPLALGTAIYLQKYATDSWITRLLRFFIEILSGTPSIVIGIFGLLVLVYYLRPFTGGYSLIAGSIALSILIMPVIERSIENAIYTVPFDLEEGSYALGATKWQTIRQITLPTAVSGILTGIILGFGRAAEESAVVILTAGYSQFMPEFAIKHSDKLFAGIKIYPLQDLIGTLPYSVYHAYENSNVIPMSNGFAAAFILICMVLLINFLAKVVLHFSMGGIKSPSPLISSIKRTLFNGNGPFSRTKPIPAPACTAAELADAERESAIRETQSRKSQKVPGTPTPISNTSELDWKETLSTGLQVGPIAGPGSGESPVPPDNDTLVISGESPALHDNPGDFAFDPMEELRLGVLPDDDPLFEDDPGRLSDPPGADPEAALAELELAFTPEYPLLEEDPDPRMVEVPTDGPWRRMTRNRLENTIAGITADPWEEP